MDIGVLLGDYPVTLSEREHIDGLLRQTEAAQRAGATVLVIGQHFLWPGGSRWLQPVPVLARLAAELDPGTRIGTTVMVSPMYHPVILAEELATLDVITNGQLVVGLGVGYVPAEFAHVGVPFDERIKRFEEGLELMRAVWTEDRVDFDGTYYQVRDATPHIRPLQNPLPIWIGAQTTAGIRRAARLGDAWPITPLVPAAELPERIKIFADERSRVGKPLGRLPLRREIVVGKDRQDAMAKACAMAEPWYLMIASAGGLELDHEEILRGMRDQVDRTFVLGSAQECAAQLREIGDKLPVGPFITRGNWPGMSVPQMVDYLDELGREVIPMMRDYTSSSSLVLD